MRPLVRLPGRLFDALRAVWSGARFQGVLGTAIAACFLASLVVIDLNRRGMLPAPLRALVSTNHFAAVDFAFTVLLLFEVLGLVFALADSVANSVGKQFELLSLLYLREAFLEFSHFEEPLRWGTLETSLLHMLGDALAALLVFVVVGVYYGIQRHRPITADEEEQDSFIVAKKTVALVLLAAFLVMGSHTLLLTLLGLPAPEFFPAYFVVLIFSDVLIVLVSLRYSKSYPVVLRNSGYAVATVVIRLALTAPPYLNALLGVGSALFTLGLSAAHNTFSPLLEERKEEPS